MNSNKRITIVDALRGLALLLIVLIHFVEHFDFFQQPDIRLIFSQKTDNTVFTTTMNIISGKAYSIFALMFGFSFFIQLNRSDKNLFTTKKRFAWRLTILLVIGLLHSLIYKGDILHIYAILGFFLIPLYSIKPKYLIVIALLFAIQIPCIYNIIQSFTNQHFAYNESFGTNFWSEVDPTYAFGSLADVISFNFWKGRATVWGWTYYNGRYLQLFALFIIGLALGKLHFFDKIEKHKRLLNKILAICLFSALVLLLFTQLIQSSELNAIQKQLFTTLLSSYINLGFTGVICSFFIILYLKLSKNKIFKALEFYGKMSLSNYITQGVIGVIIFYGFGFGIYKYLGTTWSLFLGFVFFLIQIKISQWWLSRYYYGPFEWVWRSLTLKSLKIKMKKN